MKLIALDDTGHLSLQDNYLKLEDFFVIAKEAVTDQTWEFILQSDVNLHTLSFLESATHVLQEKMNNLVAKNHAAQKEALALWLGLFRRTDFLGQIKLWQMLEDTLKTEFTYWQVELKKLLTAALLAALPATSTFNLRGEILQKLLPENPELEVLLELKPESYQSLPELAKILTRKQVAGLLNNLQSRHLLQKLAPAQIRKLRWQVYFGTDLPEGQNEQLALLNAARQHEDPAAQLNEKDLKDIWKILKEDTPDNRLTVVEYLKRDLQEESENSPALLQILELFQDAKSSNVLRFHILDALLCERNFFDPVQQQNYRGVDYLPVIELFNANPLWRNLIMTYFSDHQVELEALRSQVSCELEAYKEQPEHWSARTYNDFQKHYRQWFLEQQTLQTKLPRQN